MRRAMAGVLRDGQVFVPNPAEGSTLLNRGSFGEPRSGGGVTLSLLEAVYLAETERLQIEADGAAVPFRDLLRRANVREASFEIRYLVYRDLRQRGYIVKESTPPIDFRVYPRGGAPKVTPSKFGVRAISERWVFDLDALEADVRRAAGARKSLLLAVVDEESDLTYYAVRFVNPRGRATARPGSPPPVAHLIEDRAMVLDEDEALRLHANGFYGRMVGRRLQLSLLETAHLAKIGAIEVRRGDTNRKVPFPALRTQARRLQPDFDLRLRAYEDLKARGIVVKTGFKYGSHFRAYEGDPDRAHAKYLVHALPGGHRGMWPEVSRAVRLAHGVKKELLFASVGDEVRYLELERVRP
ncbi:MAG: tRNA-intron lyase [Methanobacteriota archaeon]|nr:MAG: tRNA-intron lyase [Euryarchaeota archaeon]